MCNPVHISNYIVKMDSKVQGRISTHENVLGSLKLPV